MVFSVVFSEATITLNDVHRTTFTRKNNVETDPMRMVERSTISRIKKSVLLDAKHHVKCS